MSLEREEKAIYMGHIRARSLKRTGLGPGASFLVFVCHFLHKLGRIRYLSITGIDTLKW